MREFDLGAATAYALAVKNGYTGTEEEWLESLKGEPGQTGPKGETGPQGPQGEKGEKGDSGGVDVTAEVGQTIRVTEVDESGKPTAWEAVDYQPRTHWDEAVEILPETMLELDPEMGFWFDSSLPLIADEEHIVTFNGTEYTCKCIDMTAAFEGASTGMFVLGLELGENDAGETITTVDNEAFILMSGDYPEVGSVTIIQPLDESLTSVTVGIKHIQTVKIPAKYYDKVFYIDVTKNEDETYSTLNTPEEVNAAYESAIPIFLRLDNDGQILFGLLMARQPYFGSGRYQYIFNFDFFGERYLFTVSDNNNGGFSVYGDSATFASQIDARLKELGLIE